MKLHTLLLFASCTASTDIARYPEAELLSAACVISYTNRVTSPQTPYFDGKIIPSRYILKSNRLRYNSG